MGNSAVYVVKLYLLGKIVIKENIMPGNATKIAQFVGFCTSQILNIVWIICSVFLIISLNLDYAY